MTSTNKTLSLEAAIKLAIQNFESGEFAACGYVCDQILAKTADHPMALHLRGLSHHRQGASGAAEEFLYRALDVSPNNGLFAANTIEVLRNLGSSFKAVSIGQAALDAGVQSPSLLANLALAKYDLGFLSEAKELHKYVLIQVPNHTASINNLGSIARDEGDKTSAAAHYRDVIGIQPTHLEARNNLVTILIEMDDLQAAQIEVDALLSLAPSDPEALRSRARLCLLHNRLDDAESGFRTVITLDPQNFRAMVGLSQVLLEKNRPDLALPVAQQANAMAPSDPLTCQQVGLCHSNLDAGEAAQQWFDQALFQDPDFVPSILGKGHICMEMGDMAGARAAFERAVALDETDMASLAALSRVKKIKDVNDPIFKMLEAQRDVAQSFSRQKETSFRYALADCYDQLGRFDEAFTQYTAGAKTKRSLITYDPNDDRRQTDAITQMFDPTLIEKLSGSAHKSAQPIFVLGMPRSGTTLTESILAAHPLVTGAGELNDLQLLFEGGPDYPFETFPDNIMSLQARDLKDRIEKYLARVATLSDGTSFVTDKMPANFKFIGLIHALLPNAKIIHVARNPMASCFSGFSKLFERGQNHSYDLSEMGRYYRNYDRLMTHWAQVLPTTAFHTVSYEDLVKYPENTARRLTDFVGVPWDPACMAFQNNKRRIRTASVIQVRQKIYNRSLDKWKNYEAHLGDLKAALNAH